VRVSPTPTMVIVTEPAVSGVTVVVTVPFESVVAVDEENETEPVPDCENAIVWPLRTVPAKFLATTDRVVVEAPTVRELVPTVAVSVEPVTRTGICAVLPLAVATMVAVRVVGLLPAEKVTVALPVASLTALDALRNPLSTENVIGTLATAPLLASTTVAVIVLVLLLSEATEVGEALTVTAAAVGGGVTGAVGVDDDPEPPPPQAASIEKSAKAVRSETARDQMDFNLCSCDVDSRAIFSF
jgi:hypothetical protein